MTHNKISSIRSLKICDMLALHKLVVFFFHLTKMKGSLP